MKYEHKAIIERATRDGLPPHEIAAELLTHDLLNAALAQIKGHAVAFKNMSEQQQDAAIANMQDEFKKAVDSAVRTIAGAGTKTVRMTLKKVAIGTNYQIQGVADRTEEHLHALCDKAQDQSDVLIVLYESDYHQGLDAIRGEKDQKALELDGGDDKASAKKQPAKAKAESKPVEVTEAMIAAGREFVIKQQNGTVAGLQNQLKCGMDKAKAVHDVLVAEGILSEECNERGDRNLVRQKEPKKEAGPAVNQELYEKAKHAVITERRVSVTFLAGVLKVEEDVAMAMLDLLEADGVVSEEDEIGSRQILIEA